MAQLNQFVNDAGTPLTLPNKPTDRYSPNALARVTPKSSRGAASQAYAVWQKGNVGVREETSFSGILGGAGSWTGGTYLLFTDGNTDGYIWFTFNGVGADPAPNANNFGQIGVVTADSPVDVSSKLHLLLRSLPNTEVFSSSNDHVDARNLIVGAKTDATAGTLTGSVITVAVTEQGVTPDGTAWDGTYNDGAPQDLIYNDEP